MTALLQPEAKTFELEVCKTCRLKFQPVEWLACRVDGYCCKKCVPEPIKAEPATLVESGPLPWEEV